MVKGAKNKPEESNRMWASASFVGVLIIIGLPLWWKTTEVYRVSFPYDAIRKLDAIPHTIPTELKVLANDEATASEIAGLIERTFENFDLLKLKIHKAVLPDALHHSLKSETDEREAVEEVAGSCDVSKPNVLHVVQRTALYQDVWVGQERVVFFRDSKAAPTLVEVLKRWIYQTSVLAGARADTADAARRSRFPPGEGYHVVLSVVVPRPGTQEVAFNAADAVEDYIGSFVDELSILHNFTLKSQWLYLLDFDFQAKEVKDTSDWGRHFAVRQDRLPLLLTRLEERAATHVSELPTINLALYAVPCETAPLAIYDNDDNRISSPVQAFMSPKWGGVYLSNPAVFECRNNKHTHAPVVRVVMGTFVSQLRKLFGITETEHIEGAHLDPLRSVAPRKWEIDNLLRLRTIEQQTSAERTMQSLAQLLGEISNIVINDDVGASINSAVDGIKTSISLMSDGKLVEAYKMSQKAFLAAETAFMEPSLLALLYFPDDQKYAIYIPLFLPVMFPVILSLKNLFLWFRGKPIHKDKEKTE